MFIWRDAGFWRVKLPVENDRHSNFYDADYGSRALAHAAALLHVKQHVDPALYNVEKKLWLRKKSWSKSGSGIPGVRRIIRKRRVTPIPYWVAEIETDALYRRQYFSVNKHGEENAKELAITARRLMEIEALK